MPGLAATATTHPMITALIPATLAAITLGYLFVCWIRPFTGCRRCDGTGLHTPRFGIGTRYGLCRRCHGTRHQLRTGRHFLNHLRHLHTRADRTATTRPTSPTGLPGTRPADPTP